MTEKLKEGHSFEWVMLKCTLFQHRRVWLVTSRYQRVSGNMALQSSPEINLARFLSERKQSVSNPVASRFRAYQGKNAH